MSRPIGLSRPAAKRTTAMGIILALLVSMMVMIGGGRAWANQYTVEWQPYGTKVLAGSSWLGGNGVDAYSNGDINTVSGDYSSPAVGMKWQCVELAQRLYKAKGWDPNAGTLWGVDAVGIYGLAGFNSHPNDGTYTPVPGDMIVHSGNTTGHVAIVDYVSGNTVHVVEQNVAMVAESAASQATYTIGGTGVLSRDIALSGMPIEGIVHSPLDTLGRTLTTIGVVNTSTSTFYLRNTNTSGSADNVVQYGNTGWKPIVGDWDGNKTTTVGVYNPSTSTFYLHNSNTPGSADITIPYGNTGWTPLSGDWFAEGKTNIGVYNPNTATYYLRSSAGSTTTIQYGNAGWLPVVGDWDGNGTTTLGAYDPATSTFYLKNTNASGSASVIIQYGNNNGWIPIAGDWKGEGKTNIGLYDPSTSTFYLRDSAGNTTTVQYGNNGWVPVVGDWIGQ